MEKDQMNSGFFQDESDKHQQGRQSNKPFVSFHMLDGFKCFFEETVKKEALSYHECYQKVMHSNFLIQRLRLTTQQLFHRNDLTPQQKFRQINSRSAAHQRFYVKSANSSILEIAFGKEKEEQIQQLQRQLELYRRSGEDALVQRRRQLKQARDEQERLRQRGQQQRKRRAAVLEKLKMNQSSIESN